MNDLVEGGLKNIAYAAGILGCIILLGGLVRADESAPDSPTLFLTVRLPADKPDERGRLTMPTADECWDQAREFSLRAPKSYPDAEAVVATCYIPLKGAL